MTPGPQISPMMYWKAAVINRVQQQRAARVARLRSRQVKIYAYRLCQEMFARKQSRKEKK